MVQQGQLLPLKSPGAEGTIWAYRYRAGGHESNGCSGAASQTEQAAAQALDRALERLRQERGRSRRRTLGELVEMYLGQHDTEPETLEKLYSWLLSNATRWFGDLPLSKLEPAEIAAWRMMIPRGLRFEAPQALRQTLARGVRWEMLNSNPAEARSREPATTTDQTAPVRIVERGRTTGRQDRPR
jgi:hypothetical protein